MEYRKGVSRCGNDEVRAGDAGINAAVSACEVGIKVAIFTKSRLESRIFVMKCGTCVISVSWEWLLLDMTQLQRPSAVLASPLFTFVVEVTFENDASYRAS